MAELYCLVNEDGTVLGVQYPEGNFDPLDMQQEPANQLLGVLQAAEPSAGWEMQNWTERL